MRYGLTGVKAVLFGTLIPFAPFVSFAQPSHVLLNDAKVVITEVEVSPAEPYTLPQGQNGLVWVALDPINFLAVRGDLRESRQIHAGRSGKVPWVKNCSARPAAPPPTSSSSPENTTSGTYGRSVCSRKKH